MAFNLLISDIKFFNEFKNDVGFVSNPGDFTPNLSGSVMENVRVLYQIDISWNTSTTSNDPWSLDTVLQRISRTSGSWGADGFSIGDICEWGENGVPVAVITITSISQDGKTFYYTVNSGVLTSAANGGIKGLTPLEAMINTFGLIGNSENFNIESKVSLNDQGYYGSGIGFDTGGGVRDTNFVTMSRLGSYEDWRTGEMKVRFVSNPSGSLDVQRFEVQHDFTLVPYYLDGELSNLQNKVLTTLFNGLNTLKYVFNVELRSTLSNPNSGKAKTISNQLGSVAWFEENFNGFNNNYQVNSITYTEQPSGNSADGLLVATKTRVTMQVQKNNGNFVAGERAGVYVSYLPNQNEYQNTVLTGLKENFLYDNALGNAGSGGIPGQDFITNLTIFSPVGNLMTLFFDVEYSLAQKLRLANQSSQGPINFLIEVQLGDASLTSTNSDRINLIADVQEYDDSPDIPDLAVVTKFDAYAHNKQIGVDTGSTNMTGWNESGIVWDYNFQLNLLKQAVINTLEFKLVAFDPVSEQFFELDSSAYSVANAIVSGGIQQLSEQSTRGYILASGDQFNDKTLSTGALVGDLQNYDGRFGQKFKWQEWLSNLGVDTIFYDINEPQNNLNFKTSNYSLLNGYEIRQAIFMTLSGVSDLGVSGITDYLFLSPTLTVYDYEQDGGANIWSHVIETFNASNNAPLGGSILSGQNTLFKVTWTNSVGPVTSLADIFVINRIQKTGSPGDDIEELSSINLPPSGQKLIPKGGFTLLDIQIVGGNVVAECLIDGSLVASGTNYDLSSEIRDNAMVGGKQKSPSGDLKQKGGSSDIKLVSP